jgi:hypothetical protein
MIIRYVGALQYSTYIPHYSLFDLRIMNNYDKRTAASVSGWMLERRGTPTEWPRRISSAVDPISALFILGQSEPTLDDARHSNIRGRIGDLVCRLLALPPNRNRNLRVRCQHLFRRIWTNAQRTEPRCPSSSGRGRRDPSLPVFRGPDCSAKFRHGCRNQPPRVRRRPEIAIPPGQLRFDSSAPLLTDALNKRPRPSKARP